MAWRSWLHGAVRHPEEPRILLLRSDRAWRLPRVFVRGEFWAAAARTIVTEFERRLATKLWLLRQFQFEEDEEAQRLEGVFELELLDLRVVRAGARPLDRARRPRAAAAR